MRSINPCLLHNMEKKLKCVDGLPASIIVHQFFWNMYSSITSTNCSTLFRGSLFRRSLSRRVSVQKGVSLQGVSVQRVSVQVSGLCSGGKSLCPEGLCSGRRSLIWAGGLCLGEGVSVWGVFVQGVSVLGSLSGKPPWTETPWKKHGARDKEPWKEHGTRYREPM